MKEGEVYLAKFDGIDGVLLVKVREVCYNASIVDSIGLSVCTRKDWITLYHDTDCRGVSLRHVDIDTWNKAKKLMTFYQNGVKSLLSNIEQL